MIIAIIIVLLFFVIVIIVVLNCHNNGFVIFEQPHLDRTDCPEKNSLVVIIT